MPMDRSKYPPDWEAISLRVRTEAGWRCELCGAENGKPSPATGSKVVLTVAHVLNPDPMDVRRENLKALCQKCHNKLDAPMRVQNRRKREAREQVEAGQKELL